MPPSNKHWFNNRHKLFFQYANSDFWLQSENTIFPIIINKIESSYSGFEYILEDRKGVFDFEIPEESFDSFYEAKNELCTLLDKTYRVFFKDYDYKQFCINTDMHTNVFDLKEDEVYISELGGTYYVDQRKGDEEVPISPSEDVELVVDIFRGAVDVIRAMPRYNKCKSIAAIKSKALKCGYLMEASILQDYVRFNMEDEPFKSPFL